MRLDIKSRLFSLRRADRLGPFGHVQASAKPVPAINSTAGSRRNRGGTTVEGSEKLSKAAKKAKKVEETPTVRNVVTGLTTPIAYIQPDLERFVQDMTKGHRRTPSDTDKTTVVVKR